MSIGHRIEAEKLLEQAAKEVVAPGGNPTRALAAALVHATLGGNEDRGATYADLRDANTLLRRQQYAMRDLVSTHIAKALASRDADRWKAGRDLAQALDEAGTNVDDLVDAQLSDDGYDTKTPWSAPAPLIRRDGAAPERDPWTPAPDVTDQIPQVVRRLFAEHLARMLLNADSEVVQTWARNFAFALKNEGADLTGDIEKRITDLTLGRDPSEPPF